MLNQEQLIKICPDCKKQMKPIAVHVLPSSSEWYCATDHRSEPMSLPVAEYFVQNARNR